MLEFSYLILQVIPDQAEAQPKESKCLKILIESVLPSGKEISKLSGYIYHLSESLMYSMLQASVYVETYFHGKVLYLSNSPL